MPVLLLEDLSSKESIVDNSNRNGLVDEALRLETTVIESGNEISIDSEENTKHEKEEEEVFHKHISNGLKRITSITRKHKTFIKLPTHLEE